MIDHVIQRPRILLMLSAHLLPHASKEALSVGETGEPITLHNLTPVLEPRVKHLLTIQQTRKPSTDVGEQPGEFLFLFFERIIFDF
jgi:hypothetical protein